jgi:hypothetical protein
MPYAQPRHRNSIVDGLIVLTSFASPAGAGGAQHVCSATPAPWWEAATRAVPSWERRTGGVSSVSRVDRLAELRGLYEFREPILVVRFIERNPELLDLLVEAYRALEAWFGLNPQLALEVAADPDADDPEGSAELFALVKTELDPQTASSALDGFDADWHPERAPGTCVKLNFDVEFV